jgi:hypothetical protein
LRRLRGIELSRRRFVVLQAFGFALLVVGCALSFPLGFPNLMLVMMSGIAVANGISHALTAVWDRGYGPGLFASAFLWIPFGSAMLAMLYGQMSIQRYITGIAIGVGIQAFIAVGTMRGRRPVAQAS